MILEAEEVMFGSVFGQALSVLPTLLVVVVGLIVVLVSGNRLPGRARVLAFLGGALLLLNLILSVVWALLLPELIMRGELSFREFSPINLVASVVLNLMHGIGIGLLIGALLAARSKPTTVPTSVPGMPAPQPMTSSTPQPTVPTQWGPPTS